LRYREEAEAVGARRGMSVGVESRGGSVCEGGVFPELVRSNSQEIAVSTLEAILISCEDLNLIGMKHSRI
jgi:hypothetical protein